jgi:TPR repeat protein
MAKQGDDGMYVDYSGNKHVNETEADRVNSNAAAGNYGSSDNMTFTNSNNAALEAARAAEYQKQREKDRKDWEEISKKGDAVIAAQVKKLHDIEYGFGDQITKLRDEGLACNGRKDWDGAISAFTKAIGIITGQQFEQYKQDMLNQYKHNHDYMNSGERFEGSDYDKRMQERIQWWPEQAKIYKKWLAGFYFERSKVKDDEDKYDEAVNDAQASVIVYPSKDAERNFFSLKLADRYRRRAFLYFKNKDYDRAITDYSVALYLFKNFGQKGNEDNEYEIESASKKLAECYTAKGKTYNGQEDPTAQKVLAEISKTGVLPTAPQQTASSSSTPSADDLYEQGTEAYNAEDYAKAVELFRKSADMGNDNAQNDLGNCYLYGNGVPQDYKKAAEWHRKSADQGHEFAQYNLANSYYNGEGIPQDYKKASEWYRKSADQGNADAQRCLGVSYDNGNGVPQDYKKAAEWYRKAADQGDEQAQQYLEGLKEAGLI